MEHMESPYINAKIVHVKSEMGAAPDIALKRCDTTV